MTLPIDFNVLHIHGYIKIVDDSMRPEIKSNTPHLNYRTYRIVHTAWENVYGGVEWTCEGCAVWQFIFGLGRLSLLLNLFDQLFM